MRYKYPFALSTNNAYPVKTRFLVSLRTKNDFDNVLKYHPDNTPDRKLEIRRSQNPYSLNKNGRNQTKGIFSDHNDVIKALNQNDGIL